MGLPVLEEAHGRTRCGYKQLVSGNFGGLLSYTWTEGHLEPVPPFGSGPECSAKFPPGFSIPPCPPILHQLTMIFKALHLYFMKFYGTIRTWFYVSKGR